MTMEGNAQGMMRTVRKKDFPLPIRSRASAAKKPTRIWKNREVTVHLMLVRKEVQNSLSVRTAM